MKPRPLRPGDVVLVLPLVVMLGGPLAASATPRYALRVGQSCTLCHQNPDGGGQRSAYASGYLVPERLARPRPGAAPTTNAQISPDLLLGADLRTFWRHQEERDSRNNFVQMQGAVYATLQLDPHFSAYVHEEMGQGSATAYELFGTAWLRPGTAYVKIGRFVPAFGWRPADHRTFTRRAFVFLPDNPPQSDTGVELGLRRGPTELQLALTNGEFASPFELNDELAFVARGAAMRTIGAANLALGASYAQHRGADLHRRAGGPFAGASWGPLTWWGEFDWMRGVPPDPDGGPGRAAFTSFTTSQELSVQVRQGFDLVATYDFHDADVDYESGAGTRLGGGVEAFLDPFLRVRAKVNRLERDDGPRAPPLPDDVLETEIEVHFLY